MSASLSPTAPVAPPHVRESLAVAQIGADWGAPQEGEQVETLAPKPIRRLPSNVKQFIVIYNACGASPSEVVKAVKSVFDLDVSPSNIEKFDPTKVSGQSMAMELKGLFRQAQREYQQMVVKAGIADQKWRLAKLHVIAQTAFDRGNMKLCMEAMEQAAKDVGGAYTNKSQVQVDDKRMLLAKILNCAPEDLPSMKAAMDEIKEKEKVH